MKPKAQLWKSLAVFSAIGTLFIAGYANAHPVTYQGAFGVMSWNSSMMSDHWLSYTLTPRFAVAARYFGLRGGTNREFYFPQFNFLLKRWNEADSQANLYLSGAYGLESTAGTTSGAALAAIEADWETRRYYISGKYQAIRLGTGPLDYARARVGYAPYLAEFNELHTWLMIQAEYQPNTLGSVQVTPLLIFFYQNVLWEVGASTTGNWMFNFMVHF